MILLNNKILIMTHSENKSSKELRTGMSMYDSGQFKTMIGKGKIVIYQSHDGITNLEVKLEEDTV